MKEKCPGGTEKKNGQMNSRDWSKHTRPRLASLSCQQNLLFRASFQPLHAPPSATTNHHISTSEVKRSAVVWDSNGICVGWYCIVLSSFSHALAVLLLYCTSPTVVGPAFVFYILDYLPYRSTATSTVPLVPSTPWISSENPSVNPQVS
jgi:hypothetical protein